MSNRIVLPSRLNIFLSYAAMAAAIALLWAASRVDTILELMAIAVLFAFVMVPIYSLLHEAEHGLIHPNKRINNFMGVQLAALFGTSFTFLQQSHLGHHRRNRTDAEMFDLHYQHQSRFRRNLVLSGGRIGFFWYGIVLTTMLVMVIPRLARVPWVSKTETASPFFYGLEHRFGRPAQRDAIITILVHVVVFYLLDLSFIPYITLLTAHAFIWSSQNYVGHAYSERDILNGAHNHTMNPLMQFWYLNFNFHLAHHQHPSIPWTQLPNFVDETRPRIPFWLDYMRFWRGVRLTNEPAPRSLDPGYEARIHEADLRAMTSP